MHEIFPIAPHGAHLFRFGSLRASSIVICALVALAFLVLPVTATAPVASFTVSKSSGTIPMTVTFTSTSTNTPTSLEWDFGDGNSKTTTSTTTSHTYEEAGTFTVTLTATNGDGSTSTTKTVTAKAKVPVASFTADVTGGIVPLIVQFEDTSTNDPTEWSWTFGDGDTSTDKDPQHTYEKKGTYTVVLKVTNSGGDDTITKSKYITVAAANEPVASFKSDITSGSSPLKVQFNDTSTYFPTSWEWDFGDGGTSDEQNPLHKYTKEGQFTVTLTVTNDVGDAVIEKEDYITVGNKPVASFTASPVSGTIPLSVSFTDTSTYSPDTWYWSFGDGYSATSQNPSHTYNNPGTYSVTLTATNDVGSNSVTKASLITVSAVTTATTVPTTIRTTVKTTATTAVPKTTATTAAAAASEENSFFSLPVIGGIVLVVVVFAGVFLWKGGRGGRRWDL